MRNHGEVLIEAETPTPAGECAALSVTCRCGQVFHMHVGNHPVKLSCHTCGSKGIVQRQGVVVYLPNAGEDRPAENDPGPCPTGICEKPQRVASDAIQLPGRRNQQFITAGTTELDLRFERLSSPALPSGRRIMFRILVFAWMSLLISALIWGPDFAWLFVSFLGVFVKPLFFFSYELLFGDE